MSRDCYRRYYQRLADEVAREEKRSLRYQRVRRFGMELAVCGFAVAAFFALLILFSAFGER